MIKLLAALTLGLGFTTPIYFEESIETSEVPSEEVSEEVEDSSISEEVSEEVSETPSEPSEEPSLEPSTPQEPTDEPIEEPEVVFPCNVTININNLNYGDALANIEGGEVGDIVTLKVSPNILCKLVGVTANGVQLIKNEDGLYTFALVEGENVVSIEFAVDNEQLTYIADQIGNVKNGNWEDIFSVENLLNFISWAITLVMGSGFFLTLIKNKKIKSKTAQEIAEVVKVANELSIRETMKGILQNLLGDTFNKYLEKTDSIDETMKVLTRCFVLSQENTPESRLAIIQEITNLKTNQGDLTEQVKALINEEIKKNNELTESKKKAIEDLKDSNSKIKNIDVNKGEDSYGEI